MRTDQVRLLSAALAIFALLAAPVALAGSSYPWSASQSAAKHKPGVSAELKKLKKKLAVLERSVQEVRVNGPAGYSEKVSTHALRAAVADFEKNTEGVSGRVATLEAPLGGVLSGAFPGNVQIVDESIIGRDIAPITITSANVNASQIQIRGPTTSCTGTGKATEITTAGNLTCSPDLGSRDSIAVSSGTAPNVSGVSTVIFTYAVPTGLGDLTGGVEGQRVTLIAATSGVNVSDAAPFKLSALWLPDADDTLTLVKSGSSWYEVARSAN